MDMLGVSADERGTYEDLINEVAGLTLEGIRRRPAQLRATQAGLQAPPPKLASTSCAGFVESARCVAAVRGTMLAVSEHLGVLEEALPLLSGLAAALTGEVEGGIGLRESNTRLLEQLLPAVEAPLPTPAARARSSARCPASPSGERAAADGPAAPRFGGVRSMFSLKPTALRRVS